MKIELNDLISKIKLYNPKADITFVKKAFEYSSRLHEKQKRLSGEPFFSHPFTVAIILTELEMDASTIAAALLHDILEDADVTREQLVKEFSEEIATLVEGVTKLGKLSYESKEVRQAENFRKMLLAMGEDIRIIIIKLADRLHNMQTLGFLSREKQIENAIETREIFAPLAHRLGMWRLKWELEDLAFQFLEPEKFKELEMKVTDCREGREEYISKFIEELKKIVSDVEVNATIYGRAKHLYSIYRKMVNQNLEFDEIYDLVAVRVIVDSLKECYSILGFIHASWKPIPGRFRDYIAMPKSNGYQSLHTTVFGLGGRPIEVQIRTSSMHNVAEHGIAAHWVYKEKKTDKKLDLKMSWLRQMLDWQTDMKDSMAFMENLKIDLFSDEVFVFTPKGSVFEFPVGATPVDFAYRVHTEVGHRCMGAKINGRIVTLNHKLTNGDIIEIITGKANNPKLDWLDFVKTPGARTKIKSWFKKQKTHENIDRGKEALQDEVKKLKLNSSQVLSEKILEIVVKEYGLTLPEDLYSSIGYGEISPYQAAKKARSLWQKSHGVPKIEEEEIASKLIPKPHKHKSSKGITVAGLDNVMIRFSKCCRPLPGDDIVGFVTQGRGVSIHKKDCKNISRQDFPESHLIEVSWIPGADILYSVEVEVEAFDRVGVLKDILEKIVETNTNVSAANVRTKRGSSAFINLIVDIKDVNHLAEVMQAVRKVSDVYDVYRVKEKI